MSTRSGTHTLLPNGQDAQPTASSSPPKKTGPTFVSVPSPLTYGVEVNITWMGGTTPYSFLVISGHGGNILTQFQNINATHFVWTPNVPAGTLVVLKLVDALNTPALLHGILIIQGPNVSYTESSLRHGSSTDNLSHHRTSMLSTGPITSSTLPGSISHLSHNTSASSTSRFSTPHLPSSLTARKSSERPTRPVTARSTSTLHITSTSSITHSSSTHRSTSGSDHKSSEHTTTHVRSHSASKAHKSSNVSIHHHSSSSGNYRNSSIRVSSRSHTTAQSTSGTHKPSKPSTTHALSRLHSNSSYHESTLSSSLISNHTSSLTQITPVHSTSSFSTSTISTSHQPGSSTLRTSTLASSTTTTASTPTKTRQTPVLPPNTSTSSISLTKPPKPAPSTISTVTSKSHSNTGCNNPRIAGCISIPEYAQSSGSAFPSVNPVAEASVQLSGKSIALLIAGAIAIQLLVCFLCWARHAGSRRRSNYCVESEKTPQSVTREHRSGVHETRERGFVGSSGNCGPPTSTSNPFENPENILYLQDHSGMTIQEPERLQSYAPSRMISDLDRLSPKFPLGLSRSGIVSTLAPRERNLPGMSNMSRCSDLTTCSDTYTIASSESMRSPSSCSSYQSESANSIPTEIYGLFPAPPEFTASPEFTLGALQPNFPVHKISELKPTSVERSEGAINDSEYKA